MGIIHRDVKPENFLIGRGDDKSGIIYMIDLGLSKQFIDPNTNEHIPFNPKHGLIGTLRYISVGLLPWQFKEKLTPAQRCEKIFMYKKQYPDINLYDRMPVEFLQYYRIVSKLEFTEAPNYQELIKPFEHLLNKFPVEDRDFEWR
ncbi:MAG: putative CK1/CK1/CK1-G protein kinase, partial [Streblomastix strix]